VSIRSKELKLTEGVVFIGSALGWQF